MPGAASVESRKSLFLGRDLLWTLPWLVNIALLILVAFRELSLHAWLGGPGKPVSDFAVYWTAGRAVLKGFGAVLYDEAALASLLIESIGPLPIRLFWLYPPPALLLVAPLGLFSYETGYMLFVALSMGLWCAVAWKIWPHPLAIAFALLQLPTVFNLSYGQNGLILAAGVAAFFMMAGCHSVLSGSLLAVLAVKPHVSFLMAALVIGAKRWRLLGMAAAVSLLLILGSFVAFGPASWEGFLISLRMAGPQLLDSTILPTSAMPSVFIGLMSLSVPTFVAWLGQLVSFLFVIGLLIWSCSRPLSWAFRCAIFALSMPLATPYVLVYDMTVCGLAALIIARDSVEHGGRPLPWLSTMSLGHVTLGWLVAVLTGVQITALLGWAILMIVIRRACRTMKNQVSPADTL